eukprot:Cvel_34019.t1-p1 / transcript=Cvel_34019.t1 / gene=Cvel_34019 / organism=Chromera_velia_CCMP2878 / gene_product=hypothetical protein / transcript_product=hypothetical protein / location=Cvel_scaffold5707:3256-4109(+) / protein_length=206 / sequence_SO=supercontig / SO=protein_coding / is_pseudo=false
MMALLLREWEGSLPFSTHVTVRLKRDLGEGGFEQLVKLLNEMTKGYAEAVRFHWEVLLPKLKDYFEKNKASAYVLNTATELAASSESTMIAPLFLYELPSRLDLSLMVKSALEITEKNFNRGEFSVPQVAILYSSDATGRDFTLSAIEKQTPILVLQILAYCHLRDADLRGDCMFPQLFKLMTTRGLEVMLMRRLSPRGTLELCPL